MDEMERLAERECLARFHRTEHERKQWLRRARLAAHSIDWTTCVLVGFGVLVLVALAVAAMTAE